MAQGPTHKRVDLSMHYLSTYMYIGPRGPNPDTCMGPGPCVLYVCVKFIVL